MIKNMAGSFRVPILFGLVSLFLRSPLSAQDPKDILDAVYRKFQKVQDYQADVRIKTEIPFINILPIGAKVYFKQPDHLRVKATGIAILPRQGFDQIFKLLAASDQYDYMAQGSEIIRSIPASLINVIPHADTSDIILAKFWIDPARSLILKAQMTTKSTGTVTMDYTYGKFQEFGLCDSVLFSVDVKKFKIPKALAADLNKPTDNDADKKKDNKKGKILIRFENYVINRGIDDRIFNEK